MKSHGSVVCRRATGLGDCLVSLLPAWNYAEATSRNLVIDWRHSPYALSPEQDAFELFFDPVRSFGEIYRELSSLDEYEAADYFPPAPRQTFPERHPDDQFRTKVIKILRQLRDIDDKVLLCDFCLHDALPDRVRCRELLDRLYLRPHTKQFG